MGPLDWSILAGYLILIVGIGLSQRKKASKGMEEFFASGRSLPWWLAGTAMIAASFSSDTPLLVTNLVRNKGLWGNWMWWGFGISAVLTTFLFARFWRRARVLTETELTELRYSGPPAAGLRAFKAAYWGIFYNCLFPLTWSVVSLGKVTGGITGWSKTGTILFCAGVAALYAIVSGFWGIVMTDTFQFALAVAGGVLLAVFSVSQAGGLSHVLAAAGPSRLAFFPDRPADLSWVLGFLLIQWWAWKNTDGSGPLAQRMIACKDEREAMKASLWYAAFHYALRCWPWVMVALASLVVIPDAALPLAGGRPDAEAAYPLMILKCLPGGLRGLIIAWFFAECISSVSGAANWGASMVVNDLYRRFLKPAASGRHYLQAARWATVAILAAATACAFLTDSITGSFQKLLQLTAGVGIVHALRWLWHRANAWTEITAMIASVAVATGWPSLLKTLTGAAPSDNDQLIFTAVASTGLAVVATLLTRPEPDERLTDFYRRVRPPGPGWRRIARLCPDVVPSPAIPRLLTQWALGCGAIYGGMFAIGLLLTARPREGLLAAAVSGLFSVLLFQTAIREIATDL